ncbi:MAG: hypothetical protein CMA72_06780 [Euryarchaeota archaeon]|nr:hypothetical protein [Euryarchaeota archaeon]|tara:strand:+ start:13393 stop:13818 length:426 start_codon:yes stop_codon:yes gene_type:complete
MRITKRQLRRIIKEERSRLLAETRVRRFVRRKLMEQRGTAVIDELAVDLLRDLTMYHQRGVDSLANEYRSRVAALGLSREDFEEQLGDAFTDGDPEAASRFEEYRDEEDAMRDGMPHNEEMAAAWDDFGLIRRDLAAALYR